MVAVFEAVDSVLGLKYTDGISNTRYGLRMEETWSGAKDSFLGNFKTPKKEHSKESGSKVLNLYTPRPW